MPGHPRPLLCVGLKVQGERINPTKSIRPYIQTHARQNEAKNMVTKLATMQQVKAPATASKQQ